ncbi:MAG TPA: hypothetical protein VFX55_01505 [Duganella sp.]|nr:hypothetical protein [Duganella sp.]
MFYQRFLILALLLTSLAGCGGGSSAPAAPPIVDTDKDGSPDDQDVAPNDPLCFAPSDAASGVCYVKTLAASRLKVVGNANGKIFFNSEDDALRLYAYDLRTKHFLGRVNMVGYTPTAYAYVPEHATLYVGDKNGKVHAYSESLQEKTAIFATVQTAIGGMSAAGKYLVVQDDSGAWATHYVYDKQGKLTDSKEWNYYSHYYEWSAASSRLYFFRDDTSPNDLMFEVIDQATGKITANGETPYHGSYAINGPIKASQSGGKILLGSGDIYAAPELTWDGSIGSTAATAAWLASGELITLSPAGAQTRLLRFDANRKRLEEVLIDGEVLEAAVDGSANYLVVRKADRVEFVRYTPSDDTDGDGVPNALDKFPLDKSAAVDSDNDGHPDAFLNGMSAADSPTGLTLDFYPYDANCHAKEQGDGVNCKVVMPAFTPDVVVGDGRDMVYLLSKANNRVYRWSKASGGYVSPYVVGQTGGTTASPSRMAISVDQQRLYFGYASGLITYISLAGDSAETRFASTAMAVGGLAVAGNYLLAQDLSGAWATHYIFDKQGRLTDSKDWNYYSGSYEWYGALSRIYFFRDDTSPNDLHYETIDQASGKISGQGETPYHGSYRIVGPIRVSVGGGRIILGSGDIYSTSDLTVVKSLGAAFYDGQWLDNGALITMTASGSETSITSYDASIRFSGQQNVAGSPVAMLRMGAGVVVITQAADKSRLNFLTM